MFVQVRSSLRYFKTGSKLTLTASLCLHHRKICWGSFTRLLPLQKKEQKYKNVRFGVKICLFFGFDM
jgi:hypothetical protein